MIETRIAKLFKNGASQAVRLPVEFRFEGDEVYITRDDATAAAELGRELAEAEHPYVVAVLLAEQRNRARGDRRLVAHRAGHRLVVREDLLVHERLDSCDLGGRHRREVRGVEAQPLGLDQRALLLHVAAEQLAQRRVQEVRRRVIAGRGRAPGAVHRRASRGACRG